MRRPTLVAASGADFERVVTRIDHAVVAAMQHLPEEQRDADSALLVYNELASAYASAWARLGRRPTHVMLRTRLVQFLPGVAVGPAIAASMCREYPDLEAVSGEILHLASPPSASAVAGAPAAVAAGGAQAPGSAGPGASTAHRANRRETETAFQDNERAFDALLEARRSPTGVVFELRPGPPTADADRRRALSTVLAARLVPSPPSEAGDAGEAAARRRLVRAATIVMDVLESVESRVVHLRRQSPDARRSDVMQSVLSQMLERAGGAAGVIRRERNVLLRVLLVAGPALRHEIRLAVTAEPNLGTQSVGRADARRPVADRERCPVCHHWVLRAVMRYHAGLSAGSREPVMSIGVVGGRQVARTHPFACPACVCLLLEPQRGGSLPCPTCRAPVPAHMVLSAPQRANR